MRRIDLQTGDYCCKKPIGYTFSFQRTKSRIVIWNPLTVVHCDLKGDELIARMFSFDFDTRTRSSQVRDSSIN
jgi:hypothetical protein